MSSTAKINALTALDLSDNFSLDEINRADNQLQELDIESRAFANCLNLKLVVIDELEHIAADAFEGCQNDLTFVTWDSGVHDWAERHGFRWVQTAGE